MSGLAEVLAEHEAAAVRYEAHSRRPGISVRYYLCTCGDRITEERGIDDDHRAHVAAAVTTWLTERLASEEVREAVAFALGDLPESVNVYDITDEATTFIDAPVEYVATAALTAVTEALREAT